MLVWCVYYVGLASPVHTATPPAPWLYIDRVSFRQMMGLGSRHSTASSDLPLHTPWYVRLERQRSQAIGMVHVHPQGPCIKHRRGTHGARVS